MKTQNFLANRLFKKVAVLQNAYHELQEEYQTLRRTSLDNAHKLFLKEGDEKAELYYSYQLQCSDEQIEQFEKEYLLLLEYISQELGELATMKPFSKVDNAIELAQGYFNDWIFNYTIKEVKENE